jgi:hypothetical protein
VQPTVVQPDRRGSRPGRPTVAYLVGRGAGESGATSRAGDGPHPGAVASPDASDDERALVSVSADQGPDASDDVRALVSVSADQGSDALYPRPDSNRRYRRERAAC